MASKTRPTGAKAKKSAKQAKPKSAPKPAKSASTAAPVRERSAAKQSKVAVKAKAPKTGKPAAGDSLDALIAASAQALALTCDPAWMPSIKMNLEVILRQAALVDEFPLPDETEPAPVYEA